MLQVRHSLFKVPYFSKFGYIFTAFLLFYWKTFNWNEFVLSQTFKSNFGSFELLNEAIANWIKRYFRISLALYEKEALNTRPLANIASEITDFGVLFRNTDAPAGFADNHHTQWDAETAQTRSPIKY